MVVVSGGGHGFKAGTHRHEEIRWNGYARDEVLEDERLSLELLPLRRREGGASPPIHLRVLASVICFILLGKEEKRVSRVEYWKREKRREEKRNGIPEKGEVTCR